MLYAFSQPKAADRHKTQYFEIFGNRGIYSDGWFAGTVHRIPWERDPRFPLAQDQWELYDTRKDFSLKNDLAAKNPAKLKELQAAFIKEAIKYRVLPIDDRGLERMNASLVGRPDLMDGRTSLALYPGMIGMSENVFINIKNRSWSINADVDVADDDTNGVLLAQGGRFGGWTLYVKDGKPAFDYNFLGLQHFTVKADEELPAGKSTLRFNFAYDGGGMGKGGVVTLTINGKKVGEGRIEHTQAIAFSADETADVGVDTSTNVSPDYEHGDNKFTGKIVKIVVNVKQVGVAEKQALEKAGRDAKQKMAESH